MRHTISILVENKFGVLTRIAGMFSGRGFNIDTLNVGPTLDPETSRMTIVVRGDDKVLDQVNKQLDKLVNVISVEDFGDSDYVELVSHLKSEGVRVEITHDLELHWPLIGGFVAKYIVGLFFIHHIASLTLAGLKRKVESMSAA